MSCEDSTLLVVTLSSPLPSEEVGARGPATADLEPHLSTPIPDAGLLPGGFRAAGARIGGAERTIRCHRNRIGRGLAERLDHLMASGSQLIEHLVRET